MSVIGPFESVPGMRARVRRLLDLNGEPHVVTLSVLGLRVVPARRGARGYTIAWPELMDLLALWAETKREAANAAADR